MYVSHYARLYKANGKSADDREGYFESKGVNVGDESDDSVDDSEFNTHNSHTEHDENGMSPATLPSFPEIRVPTDDDPPDLVIVSTNPKKLDKHGLNHAAMLTFEKKLVQRGLVLQKSPSVVNKSIQFLILRATWQFLAETAEKLELRKSVAPNDLSPGSKAKKVGDKLKCIREISEPSPCIQSDMLKIPYRLDLHKYYMKHEDLYHFFSPSQKAEMIQFELERTQVHMKQQYAEHEDDDEAEVGHAPGSELISYAWLVNKSVYHSMFIPHDTDFAAQRRPKHSKPKNPENDQLEEGTDAEAKHPSVDPVDASGAEASKKPSVESDGKKPSVPLRLWLSRNWASFTKLGTRVPLNEIKEYLGQRQAFYFAWMDEYTSMLFYPALLSVLLVLLGIPVSRLSSFVTDFCSEGAKSVIVCPNCPNVECPYSYLSDHCRSAQFFGIFDNVLTILYSVFIAIWAVVFLETWNRKESYLGSLWISSEKLASDEVVRADYLMTVTTMRKSRITGEPEQFVRRRVRVRKFLVSFLFMATALGVVIGATIFVVIADAVISSFLANDARLYTLPGPVSDVFGNIATGLIHLIFISLTESVFFGVAKRLSIWELHRTEKEFQKSLTTKAVIFQFMNYYSIFVYTAFLAGKNPPPPHWIERPTNQSCGPLGCMDQLMIQLFIIMTFRQVLQNIVAVSKPALVRLFHGIRSIGRGRKGLRQWEKDYGLPTISEPSAFKEYSDRVVQYGFITMFSPAFPLCALFAWINNLVILRLDAMRVLYYYRRPVPMSIKDIGPWRDVMAATTKVSIIVNAVLLAFNSMGLELFFVEHLVSLNKTESVLQHLFATFNTSDFASPSSKVELYRSRQYLFKSQISPDEYSHALTRWDNITVDSCVYKGRYERRTGSEPGDYELTPLHMQVLLGRLAFCFILQNFALLLTEVLQAYIANPSSSKEKTKTMRETFLFRQLVIKLEEEETAKRYKDQMKTHHQIKTDES